MFKIPSIQTSLEFTDTWPALKFYQNEHVIEYDLFIEEDDTEVLINLITKPGLELTTYCCLFTEFDPEKNRTIYCNPFSFRANLNSGKYTVRVELQNGITLDSESCEQFLKYLENGGNEFVFRLAASKKCSINKKGMFSYFIDLLKIIFFLD